jgi:hypothetical protein
MRIILSLIILALQGMVSLITLMVIYLIFVLLDYQGGIDSFIGTTLFQPIIGGLISILTIGICLLIGLPIRISDRINTWWTERIWLSILGILIGLTLLSLSLVPSMMQTINKPIEDVIIQKRIPNLNFAATGWFLTAFSLLHLFPPHKLRNWAEGLIARYTSGGGENARQRRI